MEYHFDNAPKKCLDSRKEQNKCAHHCTYRQSSVVAPAVSLVSCCFIDITAQVGNGT